MADTVRNIGHLGKKFSNEINLRASFPAAWKRKILKYITSKNMRLPQGSGQKNLME